MKRFFVWLGIVWCLFIIPVPEFNLARFNESRKNIDLRATLGNIIHDTVRIIARHPDGTIFYDETGYNLRTYAGINWMYSQMAGTPGNVCTYLALSNSAITPALTDTTLTGEITAAYGLQRVLGTPAHTSNSTSYTVTHQFTNTASGTQSAQAIALFNDTYSNGGQMCFENVFTQVTLNPNDTLTPTWTVTIQ
jgi:hypothetical protein